MPEQPSESFVKRGPLYAWFSGWRLAAVCLWLILVCIGGGNLLARIHQNVPLSHSSLAVGPALAIQQEQSKSSALIPARLSIPSIGVNASVEQVGRTSDGSMQTPSSFETVGWYKEGSMPGQPGNAVIDGHVNNALTSAGVFEHLDQVKLGDTIQVSNAAGNTRTFRVTSEQIYSIDQAPLSQIFAEGGPSQLVLITCDGAWDQGRKEFNERLVMYASLVE